MRSFCRNVNKRKALLIILSIIMLISTFGFVACGDKDKKDGGLDINLVDITEREILYYCEEYDVDKLIVKEENVDYKIAELFYFDEGFNKKEIQFDEMTFTQTAPYDVSLLITATRGNENTTKLVELKLNYKTNTSLERLLTSWNDNGVVKTYDAKTENLKGDAKVGIKFRYIGSYNPYGDGTNVGTITGNRAEESYSAKTWESAVVEFDVYNAHDKDLQFGYLLGKVVDGKKVHLIKMLTIVPAKSWGHITWSMRAAGYAGNFVADGGSISIKVRQNEGNSGADYNYTFYICNLDITDYDETRHEGLEVRTDAEIEAARHPADVLDATLVNKTRTSNFVQKLNDDSSFVKVGDQSIKCVYGADSSNVLTQEINTYKIENGGLLFLTENNFETVYDKFSAYDATNRTYASDTETTYVGFWVKNTTGKKLTLNVNLRLWGTGEVVRGELQIHSLANGSMIDASDTSWRYYEVELDKSKLPTLVETFPVIRLSLAVQIEGAEVGDTFYIDSFDIYHGSRMPQGEEPLETLVDYDAIGKELTEKTRTSNMRQSVNADLAYVKEGVQSTKCVYGADSSNILTQEIATYKVTNGGLLFLTENNFETVYDKFSAYDATNRTYASDTEKTYVGFWVKNTTGKKLILNVNLLLWDQSGVMTIVCGSGTLNSMEDASVIEASDTNWRYYEVELDNAKLPVLNGNYPIIRLALATQIEGAEDGDTFYVDSFDIYHGSRMPQGEQPLETLVDYDAIGKELTEKTRTSNMRQTVNTDLAYVKEGVQSTKCVYGADSSNILTQEIASNKVLNGGLLFLTENNFETVYDKFSAYDATNRTYASDTEKTYVGFWVKNTTGKKLTLNVNLRLWGNGAVVRGVNTLNSLEDASVIQASDTSWRYYEVELDKSKLPTLVETFPVIRLSLAVQIEGAEVGDTFYIDSFDIYHGSRA